MKSVGIFGAGIAGLSAAHELAKAGFVVRIYEASDSVGGMAKSYRYKNDSNYPCDSKLYGMPTEYSWRGYGQFYKNVYKIMKEIPSPTNIPCNNSQNSTTKNNTSKQSVYDTELSQPVQFILTRDKGNVEDAYNWTNKLSTSESATLYLDYYRDVCSDKRAEEYAKINAYKHLSSRLTPYNLANVSAIFGPWVGIDPQRTSLHHLMNFFRMIQYPDSNPHHHVAYEKASLYKSGVCVPWIQKAGSQWSVLKRPTSESWFDPWIKYLQSHYNVKIHYNTQLVKINSDTRGNIGNVTVFNKGRHAIIIHDYYVIATTPFAVVDIVKRSDVRVQQDSQLRLYKELVADGPHIQVSFRIGCDKHIKTPQKYMAFILPDSEYNITMYFQSEIWYTDTQHSILGNNIKTLISGTACVSYVPGKLFNKPIIHLTREEFEAEILYQIDKCTVLTNILDECNPHLAPNEFSPLIKWKSVFEVWKGWYFVGDPRNSTNTLQFDKNEEKWVSSTNTNPFKPSITTSFNNLFLAGAYVKSSVDLYSMETACATGRDAAFHIMLKMDLPKQLALSVNKPILFKILSQIDDLLYRLHLPNVVDVLITLGAILFIVSTLYFSQQLRFRWIIPL